MPTYLKSVKKRKIPVEMIRYLIQSANRGHLTHWLVSLGPHVQNHQPQFRIYIGKLSESEKITKKRGKLAGLK